MMSEVLNDDASVKGPDPRHLELVDVLADRMSMMDDIDRPRAQYLIESVYVERDSWDNFEDVANEILRRIERRNA